MASYVYINERMNLYNDYCVASKMAALGSDMVTEPNYYYH